MIRRNFSRKINNYWLVLDHYYSMKNLKKFNNYFFCFLNNIEERIKKKIKIFDIQDADEFMNDKNINILLSIENCSFHKHYKHYNKFGNFGNKNISIYLYNHINRFIESNNYIAIPIIYLQIDYLKNYYENIKPTIFTPFENKKFCLIISKLKSKTNLNKDKIKNIINTLKSIDKCDYIENFKHLIKNESCYHSKKLLNLFNQYKFIFCFENSINEGYITEKIFNVFFSRCIPLYIGSNDKFNYFNNNSFIDIYDFNKKKEDNIIFLKNNEEEFNKMINRNKINKNFNNENYIKKSNIFIKKIFVKYNGKSNNI